MSQRILVTGASGLLGRAIFKTSKAHTDWTTTGLAFSRTSIELEKVDLTQENQVIDIVRRIQPTVIIHSAAEKRADVVDNHIEQAENLNIHATEYICKAAELHGCIVIYISTDYVFDGSKPPYDITDQPNPLNGYGKTKYAGENVVMKYNKKNIVLRVPIMYGSIIYESESAVTQLINQVKDTSKTQPVENYCRRYPTNTSDVAKVLVDIIDARAKRPDDVAGIYHWSDNQNMTKYGMAVTMAQALDLPWQHIVPVNEAPKGAPRPFDSHLDTTRLIEMGISHRTPFEAGIKEALQSFC